MWLIIHAGICVNLWSVDSPYRQLVLEGSSLGLSVWYTTYSSFIESPVTLIGGSHPGEGTVQIQYEGEWGTVCDDMWDHLDAIVVCRQLGYSEGGEATRNDEFGSGQGSILLDSVQCTGNETELALCEHDPWRYTDCNHREDAGVRCCKYILHFMFCFSAMRWQTELTYHVLRLSQIIYIWDPLLTWFNFNTSMDK